jgi:hypothetical protein
VRVIAAMPGRFRVQFNELNKLTSDRAKPLRDGISLYVRSIADVISDGQQAGVFHDGPPKTLALLIIGMCNSVITWSDGDGPTADVDALADNAARLAIGGLAQARR